MIVEEKPPLNDELLVHFGIKGMRWGVRKDRGTPSSNSGPRFNVTTKQKVVATASVGAAATVGVLAATGNLGAAAAGSGRLAARGAAVTGRLLLKGTGFVVTSTFKGIGAVIKAPFKLLGREAKTVMDAGEVKTNGTLARAGKEKIKGLFSRRGKLKPETPGRVRSLISKLRRNKVMETTPIPVPIKTQLFPTKSVLNRSTSTRIPGLMTNPSDASALRRGSRFSFGGSR
jgi:hypothetical protein